MYVYADNAATTRVSDAAVSAMLPCLQEFYGNPSSLHTPGQQARELLEQARATVAECLGAKPEEIYLLENENPYKSKGGRPAHSGREMKMAAMSSEVDLRGMDTVEAICVLDRYMDEAMRAKLSSVRIIHGKGTGALRQAVHQSLKRNKFVKKYRLGVYGEGEDGVTIAEFA